MLLKLVVLSLFVVCCVGIPRPSKFFGYILRSNLWKHRYLGSENVLKRPVLFQKTEFTFTFPHPERKPPNTEFIINSIEQVDHTEHEAKVDFVKGKLGSNEITMKVTAPEGKQIDSLFHFYGMKIPRHPAAAALDIPVPAELPRIPKEHQLILNDVLEEAEPPRRAAMGA